MLWLLGVILVFAAALVLGPFLIPSSPIPGLTGARAAAGEASRFLRIPFPGTDGIDIHYLVAGADADAGAPAFVLLHGFTFNAFTWDRVLGLFGRRGRVFAYDQVPYGLSGKPTAAEWTGPSPYTKDGAIEHLFAVLDGLGLERVVLVGNSSGGTLALEAALARPERVERLILIAPWVYVRRPTMPGWVAGLPQMRRLSLLIARKLGRAGLLNLCYAHRERIDEQRRALTAIHTRVRNWDLAWGELLNASLSIPVTVSERLGEVTQPVLLLTGDQDRLVPPADTRKVAEQLPNASLVVFPGCGHVPQEECPTELWRVVDDWLAGGGELPEAVSTPGGGESAGVVRS
jgi:pimeloyl-ACP methyl ester carboxylesterase